jgi:hypothetical protein
VIGQDPYADVRLTRDGLSLPRLKWRELLFVGALRERGGAYERDPARPLPPFEIPDLFPEGARFEVLGIDSGRVVLRRCDDAANAPARAGSSPRQRS